MTDTDFAREHAGRAESQRFALEKMRDREKAIAMLEAAERLMWRSALLLLLEWRSRRRDVK